MRGTVVLCLLVCVPAALCGCAATRQATPGERAEILAVVDTFILPLGLNRVTPSSQVRITVAGTRATVLYGTEYSVLAQQPPPPMRTVLEKGAGGWRVVSHGSSLGWLQTFLRRIK